MKKILSLENPACLTTDREKMRLILESVMNHFALKVVSN